MSGERDMVKKNNKKTIVENSKVEIEAENVELKQRETPLTKQEMEFRKWFELNKQKNDPFYHMPFTIKYGLVIGWAMCLVSILFGVVITLRVLS